MKKVMKSLLVCLAMGMIILVGASTSKAAVNVASIKQTSASTNGIGVSFDREFGYTGYYMLQLSEDNQTFTNFAYTSGNTFSASRLSAGRSYYARIARSTTYGTDSPIIPGTQSASIEVVTAPDTTNFKVYQSNATTKTVTVAGSGAVGANYYQLVYNNRVIGASFSSSVTGTSLYAGSNYWLYCYPCRRSNTGFIAKSSYDYVSTKTLMNKLSTGSIGITNVFDSINVFYFDFSTSGKYDGYQWQFLSPSGKPLKTYTDNYRIANYINGKLLKYRCRTYVTCGTRRVYSAWSDCKYIGYAKNIKGKVYKKKYIKVSWSKVSNATGYTIYTSTKQKSGFKKYAKLGSKSKSIVIKKIAGKSIKKRKTYYVRIIPKVKVGKKTYNAGGYMQYYFKIY